VYDELMAEDLNKNISVIKQKHTNNQAAHSWRLIRDFTGKRSPKPCQIEGATAKERIESWYTLNLY
jgi:hypothetical protein